MDPEEVKKALKQWIKESYPILRRGIVKVEELKQSLRKANHGNEPHNLNRVVFEKMLSSGKSFFR